MKPYGEKKFTSLREAQNYACNKESVKGIVFDGKVYATRGGSTGLRDSMKKETTWIKQFSQVTFA